MRQLFLIATFILGSFLMADAQTNSNHVYVNGYTKSNGTYVQGYYRTAPNNTINDNFSTYPNVNPYTGKTGTVAPTYNSVPNLPKTSYGNNYSKSNSGNTYPLNNTHLYNYYFK
jgi:hypothetical protein